MLEKRWQMLVTRLIVSSRCQYISPSLQVILSTICALAQ